MGTWSRWRCPPGEVWAEVVAAAWASEAALLPVDHRLPKPAVRELLARGEPTVLLSADGLRRLPGGRPADSEVALVIPTSGSSGRPRLVELSRTAVEARGRVLPPALAAAGR